MSKRGSRPTTPEDCEINKTRAPANRKDSAARWREANRDAIEAYNKEIARCGSFGDVHRRF